MKIQTINPATEELIAVYDCLSEHSINNKIEASHVAFLLWKETAFSLRKNLMMKLANLLEQEKNELARLMSLEMGKPITAGIAEITKCSWLCRHYAEQAENYLAPEIIKTDAKSASVCYRPLGIVFGIMPWNFPFWQVLRFAVPAVMAGNVALLKHAPISSGSARRIEDLFHETGFPSGVFQHLVVDNEGAAKVIAHPHVSGVTLTGSERAGSAVAAHAGKFLKKSVLELGGSDPYVILADADLDLAAQCIVTSRLNNSGQVCIAAKRVIAIKTIEQELVSKIKEQVALYQMGNPLDPDTKLGPLARHDLRETLHKQIEKSVKQGAKLLLGGIIPDCKGFYYPPTIITNIKPGMAAFDEELFGPVIAVCTADNEAHAISLANESTYGLGAAVFTRDLKKGEFIATNKIEAGVCFVNGLVASDPRLPFGGIKRSGYGRELARNGILEFVNIKTIAING